MPKSPKQQMGILLFVLVENDRPLYEALQNGSAALNEMGEFITALYHASNRRQ